MWDFQKGHWHQPLTLPPIWSKHTSKWRKTLTSEAKCVAQLDNIKLLSHWMHPRCHFWFGTKSCSLYMLHIMRFDTPDLTGFLFTTQMCAVNKVDDSKFIESIELLWDYLGCWLIAVQLSEDQSSGRMILWKLWWKQKRGYQSLPGAAHPVQSLNTKLFTPHKTKTQPCLSFPHRLPPQCSTFLVCMYFSILTARTASSHSACWDHRC